MLKLAWTVSLKCPLFLMLLTSMKCNLKTKSLTHELNGFKDGYAAVAQSCGTYIYSKQDKSTTEVLTSPVALPDYLES